MSNVTISPAVAKFALEAIECMLDMHMDCADDREGMDHCWTALSALEHLGADANTITRLRVAIVELEIELEPKKAIERATKQMDLQVRRAEAAAKLAQNK